MVRNWYDSQMRLLTAALGVSAIFLLGVVYDSWVAGRVIPSLLRYIPPGSEGYVITGPLSDVWSNAAAHPYLVQADGLSKFLSGQQGDLVNIIGAMRHQCVALNTPESLTANGIDSTRGAALAVIDPQSRDYVAVIPVRDQKIFTNFIQLLLSPKHQVTFTAADSAQSVRDLRILSNASSGVRFCASNNGQPVDLSLGTVLQDEASFSVVADENGTPANISIGCEAEYSDGSTGACQCTVDGADCSNGLTSATPESEQVQDFALKGLRAAKFDLADIGSVFLAFPGPHTGLLAINAQSAAAALDVRNNFHAFQSDDSMRLALRQILGDTAGEGVVFGAMTLAYPPIFGSSHFSAVITSERLTGQVFLPWQAIEQTILSRIISTTPAPEKLDEVTSHFAEIQISDPFLGSYLKYFKTYFANAFDSFTAMLMNFKDAVQGIASEGNVTKLVLSYQGQNDGAQHFLLSLKITQQDAETFVFNQRQEIRAARDTKILQGAAKVFVADHVGAAPASISELLSYLDGEPGAMWSHYTIGTPGAGQAAIPVNVATPATPADFSSDDYNAVDDGRSIEFISPKFTSNDQKFRLAGTKFDDRTTANLKSDRYRLVAYYDTTAAELFVATDETTLSSYITASANGESQHTSKEQEQRAKLRFDANPNLIYTELINDPASSPDDRKNLAKYKDLAKYSKFNVSIEPRPEENGLSLSWVASYD
jgi:hypothetical protein